MQIMPDIPENKRGLHHWATPIWLSITQRWVSQPSHHEKRYSEAQRAGKSITIMCEDESVHKFPSLAAAARFIGYLAQNGHSSFLKAAKKTDDDGWFIAMKKKYKILDI